MPIFINTCVYADGSLNKMKDYIDKYGDDVAFEILSKADTFEWDKTIEEIDALIPVLTSSNLEEVKGKIRSL